MIKKNSWIGILNIYIRQKKDRSVPGKESIIKSFLNDKQHSKQYLNDKTKKLKQDVVCQKKAQLLSRTSFNIKAEV